MLKKLLFLSGALLGVLCFSACQHTGEKSCCPKGEKDHKHHEHKHSKDSSCCGKTKVAGVAVVAGLKKSQVSGQVSFEAVAPHKVKVSAKVKGLPANKKFGFHVHEFGSCEDDGLRAGGHFNPHKTKHGGPATKERHLGDLGNLSSNDQGHATYSTVIKGRPSKFLGRAVVVHTNADDLKGQPTGNSGGRIACGVIVASMPPLAEKKAPTSAVSTTKEHRHKAKSSPHKAVTKVEKRDHHQKTVKPVSSVRGSASADKKTVTPAVPPAKEKAVASDPSSTVPVVKTKASNEGKRPAVKGAQPLAPTPVKAKTPAAKSSAVETPAVATPKPAPKATSNKPASSTPAEKATKAATKATKATKAATKAKTTTKATTATQPPATKTKAPAGNTSVKREAPAQK